jgi:predicted DCC family thiol-disulfide oxidoreductase YuxK
MRDAEALELLAPVPPEERYNSWHLVLSDGTVVERGRGAVDLLRSLRRTRRVASLLAALPDPVLESAYSLVARHRSRLGRLVPDRPGPWRRP